MIKSIKMVGRRGPIRDLELSINSDDFVTVIGGSNGSGKTTVLDFVYQKIGQTSSSILEIPTDITLRGDIPSSVIYFPSERSFELKQPIDHFSLQFDRETTYYKRANKINHTDIPAWLLWLDYAYPKEWEYVKKWLNDLVMDTKKLSHINKLKQSPMISLADGTSHSLAELGKGERNIFFILAELFRRLTPNSVVLIDDIEQSLHIAYQHHLCIILLRLQKVVPFQLIVATHAKAVAKALGWENTILLDEF